MAITTPAELLAQSRVQLDDNVEPYLWSDDELYLYINESQNEFAYFTRCFPDSTNFTDIDIEASNPLVDVDQKIFHIRRATIRGTRKILKVMTLDDFSENYLKHDYLYTSVGYWEDVTGEPSVLILDADIDQGRLYPIPTEADVIDFSVYRYPLEDIIDENSSFEINPRFYYGLIYGVKYLAYSKQDYETFNQDEATKNMVLWNEFLNTSESQIKRKIRKPNAIRYGGL